MAKYQRIANSLHIGIAIMDVIVGLVLFLLGFVIAYKLGDK